MNTYTTQACVRCAHILCAHNAHKLHIKLQLDYVRSVCLFRHFHFAFVCSFSVRNFQTNDVFESSKDVARIHTPEPHAESNVERVSETSERDVALLNSDQTLVSTKEKSTKDKVRSTHSHTCWL